MAIRRLAEIAEHGESESASAHACEVLLDRAWGKAPQHITLGDEENEPTRAGDIAELAQLARKIAAANLEARDVVGMDEAMPDETAPVVH